jgi:hypothetical protein
MASQLDEAMLDHMRHLAFTEGRSFSYLDFQSFEFNGKAYGMTHGTYRNKIREFKRAGIVETEYNSGTAFHTLKDVHFGKRKKTMTPSMTPNHMGGSPVTGVTNKEDDEITKTAIYKAIQELPPEEKSVHDIHLTYTVPDIYTLLSTSPSSNYVPKAVSMDIHLPVLNTAVGLRIQTIVHRTDTVQVIVGCSNMPVRFDTEGIARLSSGLTRTEERTSRIVDECGKNMPGGYEQLIIPDHMTWKVVMWHFGTDSIEKAEEKFCVTWRVAQKVLGRCYTKRIKSKNYAVVRREIQETPGTSLRNALNEKAREGLKHDKAHNS